MAPTAPVFIFRAPISWRLGRKARIVTDLPYLHQNATDMLDQLVWWTNALKAAREQPAFPPLQRPV